MESYLKNQLKPGCYQFRMNPFVPWMNVKVYRESPENANNMKVRLAGVEIDASKILNRGQWKCLND